MALEGNLAGFCTYPVAIPKSFVLWLSKRKGEEITFKQIQDNWAKNNGVGRGKEVLMPLIYLAKSQHLLTFLPNSNWRVNS